MDYKRPVFWGHTFRRGLFSLSLLFANYVFAFQKISIEDKSMNVVEIGEGFDTFSQHTLENTCLEGESVSTQVGLVDGSFQKMYSWNNYRKELGFDTSVGLAYAMATGNAKAKFLMELKNTDISESYIFKHKIIQRVEKLRNPKVKDFYKKDPSSFIQSCGDRYVSQVDYGGFLNVAIQFLFKGPSAKRQFDLEFGTQISFVEIGAKLKGLSSFVRQNTMINITYHIIGADNKSFNQFFKGEDYVKCGLNDFKYCEKLLTHVANYVKGTFTQEVEKSSVSVDFKRRPYPGIDVLRMRKITAQMESHKRSLVRTGEKLHSDHQKSILLLKTRGHLMSEKRKEQIMEVKETIEDLKDMVNERLLECFDFPELCAPFEISEKYDQKILKPAPSETRIEAYFSGKGNVALHIPPGVGLKVAFRVKDFDNWDNKNLALLNIHDRPNKTANASQFSNADDSDDSDDYYYGLNLPYYLKELVDVNLKLSKEETSIDYYFPKYENLKGLILKLERHELCTLCDDYEALPFRDIKSTNEGKQIEIPFYFVKKRYSIFSGDYYSFIRGSVTLNTLY